MRNGLTDRHRPDHQTTTGITMRMSRTCTLMIEGECGIRDAALEELWFLHCTHLFVMCKFDNRAPFPFIALLFWSSLRSKNPS